MDEEDGKTGARARQSGQLNASEGVPAQSLCHRLNSVPHSIFPSKIAHCHQRNITQSHAFFRRGPAEGIRPIAGEGEAL
jgi:hypothetical protein